MSVVTAGSPWSPRQRHWLQALGHAVYRAAGDEPVAEGAAPSESAVAPASPPARAARHEAPVVPMPASPRPRSGLSPTADAAPAAAPGPASRAGGVRRPALPDRLRLALLRASGLDPSDPATQAAMVDWPLEQLRGDPAAKRAFWPRLRALRRPR